MLRTETRRRRINSEPLQLTYTELFPNNPCSPIQPVCRREAVSPSVLDRSVTPAAPASAPRTGASRDHGLGSAQASPAKDNLFPATRITPYNPRQDPRLHRLYSILNSLPRLLSLFFEIPLARPHPSPARIGIPRNQMPH